MNNGFIRKVTIEDGKAIAALLDELGYANTGNFIESKIAYFLQDEQSGLYVYDADEDVVAFISIHFIRQLALEGDFMRIGYFAVKESWHGKGIGKELEAYCTALAKQKKCDRIEVHCHERRIDAHRFYEATGYSESPKYFIKSLRDNSDQTSA